MEKACEQCGEIFQVVRPYRPSRFCSSACRMADWRKQGKGLHKITCDQCREPVLRSLSGIAHATKNHFCSQPCKGKWMSENLRGPAHPRWLAETGLVQKIRRYLATSRQWQSWRATVIANADGLCERCANPAQEAHHKREVAELLALIIDPVNGEALCLDCHRAHHL